MRALRATFRLVGVSFVVCRLIPAPAARAPLQERPSGPAERPVVVDVVATDGRGRIVENLKPSDFDLREGGTAHAIESVRLVKLGAGTNADPVIPIGSDAEERTEAS